MKVQKAQHVPQLNTAQQTHAGEAGLFSSMLGQMTTEIGGSASAVDTVRQRNSRDNAAHQDDDIKATDNEHSDEDDTQQVETEPAATNQVVTIDPAQSTQEVDESDIQVFTLAPQVISTTEQITTSELPQENNTQIPSLVSKQDAVSSQDLMQQLAEGVRPIQQLANGELPATPIEKNTQQSPTDTAAQTTSTTQVASNNPADDIYTSVAVKPQKSEAPITQNENTQNTNQSANADDSDFSANNANDQSFTNQDSREQLSDSKMAQQQRDATSVDLDSNTPTFITAQNANLNTSQLDPTLEPETQPQQVAEVQVTTPSPTPPTTTETALKIEQANPASGLSDSDSQQITDKALRGLKSVMNQKGGSVTVRLTPVELGTMRIRMNMEGGVIRAQFEASNSQTRQLLQQNMGMLRKTLEAQGLVVEQLNVNHTPSLDDFNQTNANQENADSQRSKSSLEQEQTSEEQQQKDNSDSQDVTSGFEQELLDLLV